jgi:hypothetical protein
MTRLQGRATNPPGRWKEPGAVPAADHAAQRARQGRGRHRIRRRVRRQCGERNGARGSLIPHAGAIRALVIAMIEAAFGTALMALSGGAHRRLTRRRATRGRAIRVAAIARHADRKDAITTSTDFLTKRRIHDVEAAARFDWTRLVNRGTRETTGSVCRSIEAVTEGLEGSAPGPHLDPPQGRQTTSSHPGFRGGRSAAAAPEHWRDREGRQAPAGLFDGGRSAQSEARRPSRFTRFQVSADMIGPNASVAAPSCGRFNRRR